MTDRADIERIVKNVLRNLEIEVLDSDRYNPNLHTIVLKLGSQELSRTYLNLTPPIINDQ